MSNNTNFATWNAAAKSAYAEITQGNLHATGNSGADAVGMINNMAMSSGKWYVEFLLTVNTSYPTIGINAGGSAADNRPFSANNNGYLEAFRYQPGSSSSSTLYDNTGVFSPDPWGTVTLTTTNVSHAVTGDIIGFALDVDNKKLFVSKNGTFFNSGDPANGTNPQISWQTNPQDLYFVAFCYVNNREVHANFGQDSSWAGEKTSGSANATDGNGYGDFYYTPPTGFLALCSANLPTSDDIDPAQTDSDYPGKQFNVVTYTGNDGAQSITGLGFKPDLVWLKTRNDAQHHAMFDSNRGALKRLGSSRQNAEDTDSSFLSSFDTDGFSWSTGGDNTQNGSYNYVGWCWKANGGTTSSDSSGDITVTRQSNTASGFAILTYTGNGSSDQTIAHGLGKSPAFIITKNRSSSSHWAVWHHQYTGYYGQLEDSGAWASDSSQFYTAGMTSNFIGVKGSGATNDSGSDMLAYVWSEIEGYSKFGKYEGNANTNGIFVYTGFRPKMIFVKDVDRSENWQTFDTARNTFNPVDTGISWNANSAESTGSGSGFDVDFLSNGFKMRCTHDNLNGSSTYVYGAWGDVPFKYNNTF